MVAASGFSSSGTARYLPAIAGCRPAVVRNLALNFVLEQCIGKRWRANRLTADVDPSGRSCLENPARSGACAQVKNDRKRNYGASFSIPGRDGTDPISTRRRTGSTNSISAPVSTNAATAYEPPHWYAGDSLIIPSARTRLATVHSGHMGNGSYRSLRQCRLARQLVL